jgi:hypothetical protein
VDAGNKFFNGIFQGQINSTGDQVSSSCRYPTRTDPRYSLSRRPAPILTTIAITTSPR